MKEFLRHESCPSCGSSDNVGVWSDGQKYCFGHCGYFVIGHSGLSLEAIRDRLSEESKRLAGISKPIVLPIDYSFVIPEKAAEWLRKYKIRDHERMKYKIGWSEIYESLILPAYDDFGNLVLYQRRYFGIREGVPKYHTRGFPEKTIWTVCPRGNSHGNGDGKSTKLVLVEDFLSTIKVGRHTECSPLWGSSLSNTKLLQLAQIWPEVVFWLDFNKTEQAMEYRYTASFLFNKAWVIATEKDPKDYGDQEIDQFLSGCK